MDSRSILYSKGKNDENYTPDYCVKPLLKYIPKDYTIWCPFDKEWSEFVKLIMEKGNKVIHSHIDDGEDFYEYEPNEHWDCIISNPPFTNKRKIFERCLDFNKPFALLMTNTWLNDSAPTQIFIERGKQLQLLMFDKRVEFMDNTGKGRGRPTFSSSYFCCEFLPRDLIQEHLNVHKLIERNQTKLL